MASSINASLTAGLVSTADTSGIINLQSNGTTVATISSTGLATTGNTTLGTDAVKVFNSGGVSIGNTIDPGTTNLSVTGTVFVGSTTGFNSRKLYLLYNDIANNGFAINESTGAASTQFQLFASNGTTCGSIVRVGATSAVTYGAVSDYRLKTVTATLSDAGKRIDSLKPIEYDWSNGDGHSRGFLAHEFAEVYPNSVAGEKDAVDKNGNPSYQSMQASTSEVMADLIAEIQSLRKRVAQLELK